MSPECPVCGGTDRADCDAHCRELVARAERLAQAKRLERHVYLARLREAEYRAAGDDRTSPRLADCLSQIARWQHEIAQHRAAAVPSLARAEFRSRDTLPPPSEEFTLAMEMI